MMNELLNRVSIKQVAVIFELAAELNAALLEQLPGYNLLPILKSGQPTPRQAVFGETFAHDVADIEKPAKQLL